MTVIQSEQMDNNDQTADGNPTAHEVEGEIREFVRRDLSVLRRPRPERSEAADNVNSLIQRVSGASVIEIERVIAELTSVRDMLRSEGERVQREITGYASLSQAAMTSMKIIADSLAQWNPRGPQARQGNG
jgi:uncharacterized sporulation protein YeaH/YhbH (DUF444 family)